MAKFNGFVLTEKGRELLAKGLAGETITFTKMAIGDGTSLTSERERTELVNQITTLPILNINAKKNGTCEINALLTNKSVTTGFYIKELGIFAHGNDNVEILYAYNISTSPDFVPPFSANNVVEIEYVDTIIVDQVENITATIDPAISYITKKYAEDNFLTLKDKMKMMGLEFGGNIQDIGNKIKGKFYFDNVTKFYYECIENTNLTYNDATKFRGISNKPISDRVEDFSKTETKFVAEKGIALSKKGDLVILTWDSNYYLTGSLPRGTVLATLPAGYHPNSNISAPVAFWNSNNSGTIKIGADGHITWESSINFQGTIYANVSYFVK